LIGTDVQGIFRVAGVQSDLLDMVAKLDDGIS
jgi:hypothetical protein